MVYLSSKIVSPPKDKKLPWTLSAHPPWEKTFGRGWILIPGFIRSPPTLAIYKLAQSLPLGCVDRHFPFTKDEVRRHCICICFDGVVIAAQSTATFLRSIVLPRIWVLGREYADYILLRGLVFQALGSLTSLKSQTRDPQLKVRPGGLVLRIFTSWKNPSTSAGFEPANLGSRDEHVTLRPPRPTPKAFLVHLWYF